MTNEVQQNTTGHGEEKQEFHNCWCAFKIQMKGKSEKQKEEHARNIS